MSSLNRVSLLGRVGADPEVRTTGGGLNVANFRIATSETWRDKQSGEKKEQTQWHSVVCFNENLTKIIQQYVKKGSQVLIEGQLEHRQWDKPDGGKGYATEVVMRFNANLVLLGAGGGGGGGGGRDYDRDEQNRGQTKSSNPQPASSGGGFSGRASSHLDDDIPFAPEFR